VIVDRLRSRFGAEVTLKPPRVPYMETIRRSAKAHGRHKKQSGGPRPVRGLSSGDRAARARRRLRVRRCDQGGAIPRSFIPAVEKGAREALDHGVLAGYPVKDVRVRLFDGLFPHRRLLGARLQARRLARGQAGARAGQPVLLEPVMLVTLSIPEESVGDVIGDLNSRRGRPQGMEPAGTMTEVKAEVPMAELLGYAPELRSLTGGQGDYTMEFLRLGGSSEPPRVKSAGGCRARGCGPGRVGSPASRARLCWRPRIFEIGWGSGDA